MNSSRRKLFLNLLNEYWDGSGLNLERLNKDEIFEFVSFVQRNIKAEQQTNIIQNVVMYLIEQIKN